MRNRDTTPAGPAGKAAGAGRLALAVLGALLLAAASAACGERAGSPPNVILITVDTLRADRLGVYGSPLALTPRLDRLAARSVVFSNAYASAPSTFPSVVAIHTGDHPEAIGAVNNYGWLPQDVTTLATWLGGEGWMTGAVVSNFVLSDRSGLGAGFDGYDARYPQAEAVRGRPERTAGDTRAAALEMADRMIGKKRPIFLWVHFQDPHGPYTPPGDLARHALARERASAGGRRRVPLSPDVRGIGGIPTYQVVDGSQEAARYRAAYDGEVLYTDREAGRLLEGLAVRNLLENAVVVFTADHGEGMGEGDYWFAHGEYLTGPLLHVPLFISAPALDPGTRADVVSLVDLFPTLAALLGKEPPRSLPGRNLFAEGAESLPAAAYFMTLPKESTVPRFGLARNGYKYVVSAGEGGTREKLVARGNEAENLAASREEVRRAMRAELDALRSRFGGEKERTRRALSGEDRERLRALGYVSE